MRTVALAGTLWLVMTVAVFSGSGSKGREPAADAAPPRAVCEVHGVAMKRVRVPLTMGLPAARWRDDPRMRRAERFPHSALRVFGECCIEGDEPKNVGVFHCSECLRGAFAWEAAHRVKAGRPPPVAPPAHRAMGRQVAKRLAVINR